MVSISNFKRLKIHVSPLPLLGILFVIILAFASYAFYLKSTSQARYFANLAKQFPPGSEQALRYQAIANALYHHQKKYSFPFTHMAPPLTGQ